MNKWWIVIILMITAVAVNIIFWGFVNRDNGGVVLDEKNGRWVEFIDQNIVRFMVATELKKEERPNNARYWFEQKKNHLAMFYEKMPLAPNDDPNALIRDSLVNPEDCENFSNVENFSLLKNCPYQDSRFDFIYFKQGDVLGIVGLNTKYFSKKEIEMMIKQITVYKN